MKATTKLRHWPFYTALFCGALTVPALWFVARPFVLVAAAITFFCVYLFMSWRRLRMMTGRHLKTHARNTDEPEAVIFLVTFGAATTALVSLFFALNAQQTASALALALAFASVVLGCGVGCGQPLSLTLIYNLAPPGRQGEATGVRVSVNHMTNIAVPLFFGSMGTAIGFMPSKPTNAMHGA